MVGNKERKKNTLKDENGGGSNKLLSVGDSVDLETMERMLNSCSEVSTSDEDGSNYADNDDSIGEDDDGIDTESEGVESVSGESANDSDSDHKVDLEGNEVDKVVIIDSEKCEVDLRNLTAFNTHQINHSALYSKQSSSRKEKETITANGTKVTNEDYLLEKATGGCSQLLRGLWTLETVRTDIGPLAVLPSYFDTVTPRALVSSFNSCVK
jgi:hypothetical protein